MRGSPLICKLWHYPWTLLIDRTSSHMNALALTLDLFYSEGVVLSASSGLSPGRLILRGTQTFCFRRHGSSQILILSSGMLILSTGVEPESLKSICLRTLPPKSFGHQNRLRQNTNPKLPQIVVTSIWFRKRSKPSFFDRPATHHRL